MTNAHSAIVYHYETYNLWGVTLYDAEDNQARYDDGEGDEIETEYFARKPDAEKYASDLIRLGRLQFVDVYRRAKYRMGGGIIYRIVPSIKCRKERVFS